MQEYVGNLFRDADGHLCRTMYRLGGLQYALEGLLSLIGVERPLVRINTTYCVADCSAFISLDDTRQGLPIPTKFRHPGRTAPIIVPDRLYEDIILNNLDSYKHLSPYTDPVLADIPFLCHKALLRLPFLHTDEYVLLFNFWSDVYDAFHERDIPEFRRLATPLAEELLASLPDIYDERLHVQPQRSSGVSKLKMCAGLVPVLRQVEHVAPTDYSVLVMGETGAGKEAVADAVYELSNRNSGPFIKVNCAAIPETLVDSELFGHEKGAFTGAAMTKQGYFEMANGGTIFLDEIGEMPLSAQARLLRVLDSGVINRVGNALPISLNIRVIAATNQNLPARVREGTFRKDLWYRLSGFTIEVPPLRARHGDIPALVNYFVRSKIKLQEGYHNIPVPQAAMEKLYQHDWPGNVRELEHVVERALARTQGKRSIHFELDTHLSVEKQTSGEHLFHDWPSLREMENRYIQEVLKQCQGKLTGDGSASAILGIHYTTLRAKMRQMGLPLPRDA